MFQKILWILCSTALASAGVIGTDYSPATLVSYSSISTPVDIKTYSNPNVEKTITAPFEYTKIIKSSPGYESVLTTQESNVKTPDGAQHIAYSKSLDTSYSSINKYDSQASKNDDVLTQYYSTEAYSPIIYHHPDKAYTISSPSYHSVDSPVFIKSISVPVTYTTHNIPSTKTISTPSITSYTTPVFEKTKIVSSGLPTFSTHLPAIQAQSLTKSDVPITYTTHEIPFTKTISTPSIASYTPVLEKSKVLSSGSPKFQSYLPVIEAQTFTKSEVPITYTTHDVPLTKTISTPSITSYTPVLEKTKDLSSGLSTFESHSPVFEAQTLAKLFPVAYTTHSIPGTKTVLGPSITSYTPVVGNTKSVSSSHSVIEDQPLKTTFTYSAAPIVSRMSFSGLGTSYKW